MTNTQTTETQTADAERESAVGEAESRTNEQHLSTADISGATEAADAGKRAVRDERPTPEAERREPQDSMEMKRAAPLFAGDASSELRERWTEVQTGFVDQPREAVEQADALVAEVMKRLADSFATERQALEQQWSRGDDVSTEELRLALRRYRSFFDRLLSV
jgi:hypothetical protein